MIRAKFSGAGFLLTLKASITPQNEEEPIMEFVTGLKDSKVKLLKKLEREESVVPKLPQKEWLHSIRDMGEISFVILRSREGLLQTVVQDGIGSETLKEIREGQAVRVTGTVFREERAPHGIETTLRTQKSSQSRKSRCRSRSTNGNFRHRWKRT